ncbi:MAG TPA: hypothetical protein VNK94_07305 [Gaiellaceae bacterium]|nr:hypothetical protein [Gaiellaceae bacterium]
MLDLYARNRAKLIAIDRWLETNPMIDEEGQPAAVLKVYWLAHNAAMRALAELRGCVADLRREDLDIASALAALDREGPAAKP